MKSITEYPKGAIKTLAELRALGKDRATIWKASRQFKVVGELKLYGTTGVDTHADDWEYHWVEVKEYNMWIKTSLEDHSIGKLNGYNDWFFFTNQADANAWGQP